MHSLDAALSAPHHHQMRHILVQLSKVVPPDGQPGAPSRGARPRVELGGAHHVLCIGFNYVPKRLVPGHASRDRPCPGKSREFPGQILNFKNGFLDDVYWCSLFENAFVYIFS